MNNSHLSNRRRRRDSPSVSSISLVEVVYLVEKNRLPASAFEDLRAGLRNPDHVVVETPVSMAIIDAMRRAPRDQIPDKPDRIIAGTGLSQSVPVISRNGGIRASSIESIW